MGSPRPAHSRALVRGQDIRDLTRSSSDDRSRIKFASVEDLPSSRQKDDGGHRTFELAGAVDLKIFGGMIPCPLECSYRTAGAAALYGTPSFARASGSKQFCHFTSSSAPSS